MIDTGDLSRPFRAGFFIFSPVQIFIDRATPNSLFQTMALDIKQSNFQTEVIEASRETPVLVDFWAPWCGPCRQLGPLLEKLEAEYDGRFKLVKINTDEEQHLAAQFEISGIPDCRLIINGETVQKFTGALPEPYLRQFFDENLPDPETEALLESEENPAERARKFIALAKSDNRASEIIFAGILFSLQQNSDVDEIKELTSGLPEIGPHSDFRSSMLAFLESDPSAEDLLQLQKLTTGQEQEALEFFLDQIEQTDQKERTEKKGRILLCFFILGNSHPLVNTYRRKLASLLF